jgi:hypothetical protein
MVSSKTLATTVGALALGGYFCLARVVGDLYPFSTFGMYSRLPPRSASRIVALDTTGTPHELTAFDRFDDCVPPVDTSLARCIEDGQVYTIDYVDREAQATILARTGESRDGESIEIVRRIWRLDPSRAGSPSDDCLISRCRAERR